MDLILENIRGFTGEHRIRVAPLTLLTGENSTGKSTILASLAAISERFGFPPAPNFNRPPFDMGSFDTIASRSSSGVAQSFSLGFSTHTKKGMAVVAQYRNHDGMPSLQMLSVESPNMLLKIRFIGNAFRGQLVMRQTRGRPIKPVQFKQRAKQDIVAASYNFFPMIFEAIAYVVRRRAANTRDKIFGALSDFYRDFINFQTSVEAVAPIRTKPRRYYDKSVQSYSPEGEHIPFALSRILQKQSNQPEDELMTALRRFGRATGLFKKLNVHQLGRSPSQPFEIVIGIGRGQYNIRDVGYGVSQVLPVLIEAVGNKEGKMPARLLLQQPEVHLHPKAQAELGTLFSQLVRRGKGRRQFVIETHSDFIINRVRQEIANNAIEVADVAIHFLSRNAGGIEINEIALDAVGNIQNAPPRYRQFFIDEELNMLTRGEK